MTILIDFDGTCTKHAFPKIGDNIGAVPVLKELVSFGHRLILFTMRSDMAKVNTAENPELVNLPSDYLRQAVEWFHYNEIPLYGIQKNPQQHTWTKSPKAYGHLMIDDSALGCPLIFPGKGERPYVDWVKTRELLVELKYLLS